jgi:hypothetical protein
VDPIEEAVVLKLRADATLDTLAPGGVYLDVAKPNVTEPFVIVTLQAHADAPEQSGATAYETAFVLVKAVGQSTSRAAVSAAFARIHAVLQNATLTLTGGTSVDVHRTDRIAYVEVDGPVRWQHSGGIYAVMADPT